MKLNRGRYFTALTVGVASVWFSSHCGPGFASGTQEVYYFVRHGWTGFFLPAVSMTLVGITMYYMLEFSRLNQKFAYIEVYRVMTTPADVVLGKIYDVVTFITMMLGPSACLAAGGVLFNQYLGLPVFIGTLIMLVLCVIVVIFGAKVVRITGTALTVAMIVLIVMLCGVGIVRNWDVIAYHVSNRVMYTSYGEAFQGAWTYFTFQCLWTVSVSSAVGMRYRNEARGAAFIGIILNAFMLMSVCTLILSGMPIVATDPDAKLLPTIYIVNQLGVAFFDIAYPILLFLALLTTLVGFVLAIQTRLALVLFKNIKNKKLQNAVISTGFLILVWGMSQFGLIAIISKGYTFAGWIALIFWLIPMLTIGMKNLAKYRKMEREGLLPPGMDNRIFEDAEAQ